MKHFDSKHDPGILEHTNIENMDILRRLCFSFEEMFPDGELEYSKLTHQLLQFLLFDVHRSLGNLRGPFVTLRGCLQMQYKEVPMRT